MAGTWYALRSGLRRRWLSYVALTVLLAVGGGASLAAVAGARRTVSAYPRYLHASNASDVSLDAEGLAKAAVRARVAHLPGVISAASYQGFYVAPFGPSVLAIATHETPDPDAGAIVVRFKPGADKAAVVQRLRAFGNRHPELTVDSVFTGPKRPADIVNFREMGLAPTIMAVLFGVVALSALGNALVTSVRRRRRDFALFKALGVTRRQMSVAVAWQATITMSIALLIGFPVGVTIGRVLWTRFAESVGVVPHPTVPLVTLTLVAVSVLVLANLIAALPGRAGSRTEAAVVLRSE